MDLIDYSFIESALSDGVYTTHAFDPNEPVPPPNSPLSRSCELECGPAFPFTIEVVEIDTDLTVPPEPVKPPKVPKKRGPKKCDLIVWDTEEPARADTEVEESEPSIVDCIQYDSYEDFFDFALHKHSVVQSVSSKAALSYSRVNFSQSGGGGPPSDAPVVVGSVIVGIALGLLVSHVFLNK